MAPVGFPSSDLLVGLRRMRVFILAFSLGVLLLQTRGELPGWGVLTALAFSGLLLFAGATRLESARQTAARVGVVLAGLAIGFAWAGLLAQWRLSEVLPEAWEGRDLQISGVVVALPQRFERGERFEFEVDAVHTPDAAVPARILLSWYHGWDELGTDEKNESAALEPLDAGDTRYARAVRPGERWRFTVRLKRPHGSANPYGQDYEAWLLERGLRATGTIRARPPAERLMPFVWRPETAVERLRDGVRERFLEALSGAPYAGVLIALAIGDQRAIPAEQWQVFNRTGVTHLVSISGLHVTMLAALVAALVGGLWRCSERLTLAVPAQRAGILAGLIAALAYSLLAGFEVPAPRTLYMLGVVVWSLCSGRHYGVSRTLLCALFVVLVLDPWAVLSTGFWLAFGAVAVLFYVGGERGAGGHAPEDDARRGWGRMRAWVSGWGAAQWAVTLGSVPLLLFFFRQFSLVSPLANALAIPVVSFVVTPFALLFAAVPWPPVLQADHWLFAQLMGLLVRLAEWPVWQQPAPPAWTVALALVGVLWCLLPRGFPGRPVGAVLLLPALAMPPPQPEAGEAWVDVLDVGQGLAVVVRTARHTLLYDVGPRYGPQADAGQRVVVPHLRAVGVRRIDQLLLSHRDQDHTGGVDSVRAEFTVGEIRASFGASDYLPCRDGTEWALDGVRFALLHPGADDGPATRRSTNASSCVLRIESRAGASLLLTGDLEGAGEKALLQRYAARPADLRADAVLAPHHGGRGGSGAAFVAAVAPAHTLISAGYRNPFGHPHRDVLERYAASRVWRTDRDGALHLRLADTASVSAWRQQRSRYWHGR